MRHAAITFYKECRHITNIVCVVSEQGFQRFTIAAPIFSPETYRIPAGQARCGIGTVYAELFLDTFQSASIPEAFEQETKIYMHLRQWQIWERSA